MTSLVDRLTEALHLGRHAALNEEGLDDTDVFDDDSDHGGDADEDDDDFDLKTVALVVAPIILPVLSRMLGRMVMIRILRSYLPI